MRKNRLINNRLKYAYWLASNRISNVGGMFNSANRKAAEKFDELSKPSKEEEAKAKIEEAQEKVLDLHKTIARGNSSSSVDTGKQLKKMIRRSGKLAKPSKILDQRKWQNLRVRPSAVKRELMSTPLEPSLEKCWKRYLKQTNLMDNAKDAIIEGNYRSRSKSSCL